MTRILAEHHESVLIAMASLLQDAAKMPLVNFEIQRRMTDVPGNLLDLFFMERDAVKIQNWHTMNPMERIAQLVIVPVMQASFDIVDDFIASDRGKGGFGSTGKH